MGTGCESVNRMSSENADIVVGRWKDGRIGTFRGIKKGPAIYGGTAFGTKKAIEVGGYQGYKVLLEQILYFFQTGIDECADCFKMCYSSAMRWFE